MRFFSGALGAGFWNRLPAGPSVLGPGPRSLEAEGMTLRQPRAEDLEHWIRFFISERGRYVGGGPSVDSNVAWRAFAMIVGHWTLNGCGLFVIQVPESDTPVGSVGAWYPGGWPEKEVGWSIWDGGFEGKGVAHAAASRVIRHLFEDVGWDTAVSYINPKNSRSVNLAKRLGAELDPGAEGPPGHDSVSVFRHSRPSGS